MKIIKKGNLKKPKQIKRFQCDNCGCIFEAEKGEYKYVVATRNEEFYICECPYCHEETRDEVVTGQSQMEWLGF